MSNFFGRRDLNEYSYQPWAVVVFPALALGLNTYLPKLWRPFAFLDLPLIVVLAFAFSRRNPIAGTLIGASIGLLEDLPGNVLIGVHGLAKTLVGYAAGSIGPKIDVENSVTRTLLTFALSLLQGMTLWAINSLLLGQRGIPFRGTHELIRAAVNAAVALPLFTLMDAFRTRER